MYPLQHGFPVGQTLQRIESPDSVTFIGPINRRGRIEGEGAGVAQALRFGQIGFAAAQSFLACAQLFLRPPQLGDVLQHAKLAQRPFGLVPRHVALAMDNSHIAVGADYPVFNVIPRTVRQQGSRSRVGRSRPVLGVYQLQPALMPLRQFERLHPENSANLVRKTYVTGGEVPLPPADMRDPLRRFSTWPHSRVTVPPPACVP